MFCVFRDAQRRGLWYVTERAASKDVAIGFRADFIVPIIGAGEGDFV